MRHYAGYEHINAGSGQEISIRGLAELIGDVSGWSGRITHDLTKPDGTPRKLMDSTRLRHEFGWSPRIGLREGIDRTFADYAASASKV